VCPAKYRKAVFAEEVEAVLKEVCIGISFRYEIQFLEIGVDKDHIHFLVQSVPMYSPKKVVQIIKSITAREIFTQCPEVKKKLWGGEFWTKGYFVSTVGKHGDEVMLSKYVKNQGVSKDYKKLHQEQLSLLSCAEMVMT
jgi:REP element-mobilizing transposase RayT